jgi:hypothetical protein
MHLIKIRKFEEAASHERKRREYKASPFAPGQASSPR